MQNSQPKDPQSLIKTYNLTPHPEGGYYRELYRSTLDVNSPAVNDTRSAVTHIYYLLLKGDISRFHLVHHDEIWHVYEGAPLKLIQYDGANLKEELIGSGCQDYFSVVKRENYQAAETTGDYTLIGCTVAPGFDFKDHIYISDDKEKADVILNKYPEYKRFL